MQRIRIHQSDARVIKRLKKLFMSLPVLPPQRLPMRRSKKCSAMNIVMA